MKRLYNETQDTIRVIATDGRFATATAIPPGHRIAKGRVVKLRELVAVFTGKGPDLYLMTAENYAKLTPL